MEVTTAVPPRHRVVLALLPVALLFVFNPSSNPLQSIIGFSIAAYLLTAFLIPALAPQFARIGLYGRDLSKPNRPQLPETIGAVSAVVYLGCMFFFIPFMFYKHLVVETSGGGNREVGIEVAPPPVVKYEMPEGDFMTSTSIASQLSAAQRSTFPHSKLSEYLSALLSLFSMLVLGVADDLFDIRWRNKLLLPAVAVLPLMIVYYVDFGVTRVVVPQFLTAQVGASIIDLGWGYYFYIMAIAIFCPNSINILAGVNGLEAGQSLVICIGLLLNDAFYLFINKNPLAIESHLLSTYFLLPLAAVTLALLKYNWYPAKVFVGDTYCYFAGMVFAVVGILGHFSKTLLVFFVPQVLNFIYSAPQLFKIVDCPRHRMPKFNEKTGLLEPSKVEFSVPPKGLQKLLLMLLYKLGLIALYYDEKKQLIAASNMTLINLLLTKTGPLREDKLATILLGIQAGCCVMGLICRHTIAALVFGRDNLS